MSSNSRIDSHAKRACRLADSSISRDAPRRSSPVLLWYPAGRLQALPAVPRTRAFSCSGSRVKQAEGEGEVGGAAAAGGSVVGAARPIEQADHEVVERRHDVSCGPQREAGGIFVEGHVAPIVQSVF